MSQNKPEVWLRGPLPNIPPLLQPVAHALVQVNADLHHLMTGFPDTLLWERPAGIASPGFHLQHLTGVLDRIFTYARGEMLNQSQLDYLAAEDKPYDGEGLVNILIENFNLQVDNALQQLTSTDETTLTAVRGVGRAQTQSTVIGLLFHAAEHSQRHYGQLYVTVHWLLM